jgi:hypothetical protein
MMDSSSCSRRDCAKAIALFLIWAWPMLAIVTGPPAAYALSPRVVIANAGQVSDGGTPPIIASFPVMVFFDYPEVMCPTNNPTCNDKTVTVCVDFHTVGETATSDQDFRAVVSGRLSKTINFRGPGEELLGTIDVEVIGDSITEGMESFKVVLTNPSIQACKTDATIQVFEARATIVDGEAKRPDLAASDLRLIKGCQIQLTVTNVGAASIPDSAYDKTQGVAIQMQRADQPWGGIRLIGVDPTKKLKTPGASVTYVWFPNAPNLKLKPGANVMKVTVDRTNALPEANESNNTRTEKLVCLR